MLRHHIEPSPVGRSHSDSDRLKETSPFGGITHQRSFAQRMLEDSVSISIEGFEGSCTRREMTNGSRELAKKSILINTLLEATLQSRPEDLRIRADAELFCR